MKADFEKCIRIGYPTGRLSNPNKYDFPARNLKKEVFDAVREISESTSAEDVRLKREQVEQV